MLHHIMDTVFNLEPPSYTLPYKVIDSNPISDLLFFDSPYTDPLKRPIVIVPPQAGHTSHIADYDYNQSLVQTAQRYSNHPVYIIHWHNGIPNTQIDDLLDQFRDVADQAHIVGLCQAGWLATIYASLNPVKSLTIAGAPIDFHAGNGFITKISKMIPYATYESIVHQHQGVMPGAYMVHGWKNSNPHDRYFYDYIDICKSSFNVAKMKKIKKFREWYEYPQDISGNWYLWCIRNLFKENKLAALYDLTNIKCPVNIVVGSNDEITLPEQSFALKRYVDDTVDYTIDNVGHIGVFMSKKAQGVWGKVFGRMGE